jgi:hypothetical protein
MVLSYLHKEYLFYKYSIKYLLCQSFIY